jgi:hypothetical protein
VLVQAIHLLLWCLLPLTVAAQTPAPQPPAPEARRPSDPFEILDNSFIVEEAFNQERGIFQNIFGFVRGDDAWDFAFTQEWPVGSQKHQFSYTLPAGSLSGQAGFGDVLLNYRYQALMEDPGYPAISPRFSVILPTGSTELTQNSIGLQVNLPVSKQRGNLYVHANGGFTWHPRADPQPALEESERVSLLTPHLAASGIYRVRPMFNLMLESVLEFEQFANPDGSKERETVFTLSPGARGGWNLGDHQLILGAAIPITWVASDTTAGMLLYLSYELPFGR